MSEADSNRRLRWVTFGELIALAALIVSAIGVWISWKTSSNDRPTRVVEQRQAIPLVLRAKAQDDGQELQISPVEPSHALESLTLRLPGGSQIEVGSDGELQAKDLQSALKGHEKDPKDRTLDMSVRIDARYVESGGEHRGGGTYAIRYKWEGGGLFGGRSLRLVGLSRG
jgi:hypothetical protein